jgi:hypothetical protein
MQKQIAASLIAGDQLRFLDNLPDGTELRSPLLGQSLTEPSVKVRELGRSKEHMCPTTALVAVTGVNVQTTADLNRRFMRMNLDPKMERPECREFKRKDFLAALARARLDLLRSLYTVTAAYLASGERVASGELSGFDLWVRWVVQPLMWLGHRNILDTVQVATQIDPIVEFLKRLIPALQAFCTATGNEARGVAVSEILAEHFESEAAYLTAAAVRDVLGEATNAKRFKDKFELHPVTVGKWLARVHGRPVTVDGRLARLEKVRARNDTMRWRVREVAP